jgi:MYXO-CTERM domain-containing protein
MRKVLTLFAVLLAPALAHAQAQMVAIDVTYEANSMTTHEAHYDVKPMANQPANWRSPVDYAGGTVYIYLEVMTKPSALDTMIDVCFDGDKEGYGCIGTDLYKDVGVHETTAKLSTMWQYNKVAWTQKRSLFQLVIKDKNNTNGGNPKTAFLPTKLHMVLTIVPPGGTYTPPVAKPGGPDAGATTSPDAGALVEADAGSVAPATPDAAPMDPPVTSKPDAAAVTPPASKPDAAPRMDPPATDPPSGEDPPGEDPPARKASSGCSFGGGAGGAGWLVLALALLARRRRR